MKTIGMKTKKTVNQKLKRIFLSLLLPAAMTASVTCNAQDNSGIPPHQMRVASYNIQHGMGMDNQLNYKRIAEVLRAISPDVVAVQEVDSMTQRTNNTYALGEIAEQLNYYASYAPAIDLEGGKYGIGILSRERPISVRQYALPGSEEARTLLVAEFDDYVFASTHLSLTEADRMASISIIEEAAKKSGKPFVVAGDLNDKPCNDFRNGDHTTTLIRTANKKVIELQHNVMNPQPYNRLYQLTGTRGFANKYPVEGYALDSKQLAASGVQPQVDNLSTHSFMPEAEKQALEAKYDHPILKKFGKLAKEVGGHGGMDFIMTARLVYCLQNGLPLDMDVYDLAEWCSIAELGALSMDNDCAPVAFPDFTRGLWNKFKGYKHAYATPEEEAQTEAAANKFTKAYKEATAKLKLWTLYDNVQNAKTDAAKKKAQTQLDKAVAKAKNHAAKLCAL